MLPARQTGAAHRGSGTEPAQLFHGLHRQSSMGKSNRSPRRAPLCSPILDVGRSPTSDSAGRPFPFVRQAGALVPHEHRRSQAMKALIVGGGPAGASAAMGLLEAG